MKNFAVFASGHGGNLQAIINAVKNKRIHASLKLVFSNKQEAYALVRAHKAGIPTLFLDPHDFKTREEYDRAIVKELKKHKIDFIVLAGFLWLIPAYLVQAFPRRMVNIHPALLPKYGGKGMFGMHVHEAVRAANETESGITIHYVNERYDEGDIIFQAACAISPADLPGDIAKKVQQLEHRHFPEVIAQLLIPKHG